MNTEINKASECYVGYYESNPVCFLSVVHFPHPLSKNIKRTHRLVVLPDYQGIGIGHEFCSSIAKIYLNKGFRFMETSSNKSLLIQRQKDSRWVIKRKNKRPLHEGILSGKTYSSNRITYGYEFIG